MNLKPCPFCGFDKVEVQESGNDRPVYTCGVQVVMHAVRGL